MRQRAPFVSSDGAQVYLSSISAASGSASKCIVELEPFPHLIGPPQAMCTNTQVLHNFDVFAMFSIRLQAVPYCNKRNHVPTTQRTHALPTPAGEKVDEDLLGVPSVASGRRRSQAVGRKRLRCPFLAKNPLLRAPRNCTMACDPSTHIFSCALCHESSFHHIFILTEKKGFVPESNNCIGR